MKNLLFLILLLLLISACSDEIPPAKVEDVLINKIGQGFNVEVYLNKGAGRMEKSNITPGYIAKDAIAKKQKIAYVNKGQLTDVDSLVLVFDDGKILSLTCNWQKPNSGNRFWCTWNKSPLNQLAYKNEKIGENFFRSTFVFTDSLYFLAK